ncbi:cytochrome c oxidase subunit II [Stappia albiluteola]|uniref:cytochrome c oxidase subunit II n=1 Tax=Stappia albiluteola TaxID=2758565 RepID=UPI002E291041|nr:cytochrome c oxidase subunit II [Stappia albiluteola]
MTNTVKRLTAGIAGVAGFAGQAAASQPVPWQTGLQPSVTSVMDDIHWFNGFTLAIITVITLFVLALLIVCITRFSAKANPQPSRTSHNTLIEVLWTVVPILILVVIAVPSFRLLFKQLEIPSYDMTVKATGYQWYWGYEYTDENMDGLSFEAYMLQDDGREERASQQGVSVDQFPRLLAADNELVVPVGKTVRVQVTANDVIHAFAMPAFGVKVDAVPGRLNETWFRADQTGVYYGQCSELCGKDHAFMPIAVRVVTEEQFSAWAEAAKSDLEQANKDLWAAIAAEKKTAQKAVTPIAVANR